MTTPLYVQVRTALQQLLAGQTIDLTRDWGEWLAMMQSLVYAFEHGGAPAVQTALETAIRVDSRVAALLVDQPAPTVLRTMPPLPSELTKTIRQQGVCGQWLDTFIDYASQASPVTPPIFHEAAGLFLAATVIARRLYLQIGETYYYPNIYALFVAPPGRYAKSTAMKVVERVLRRAGLGHLLLPDKSTPQSLLQQFSTVIPDKLDSYSDYDREQWLLARAQAAQRAWLLDEAGFLFSDMKKEYMAELLSLLLKLFDNPEYLAHETITHGRTTIRDASLSFLGATTPKNIEDHLRSEKLWDEGLWSRFAILIPDAPPCYAEFPDELVMPERLIQDLQALDALFPKPEAELVDDVPEENIKRFVRIYNEHPPSSIRLAPGVMTLWKRYDKVLRFDLPNNGLPDTLYASYARFPGHVLRVAMILAAMDCPELPVVMQLDHLKRAITIVERWRSDLHRIWSDGIQSEETKLGDKLLAVLKESLSGLTVRDLCRQTNQSKKEITEILEVLRLAGQIDVLETKAANGRTMQLWRYSA
ncbi:DUF3987 domain-containing protein [Herpetosiphon geysericola]|uniref:DUF3987 domain-containing protein n=1 Tax=Herpetosiphon geysericola TaxID=70996 RepID=A0A0N8GP97_9CHLR|nr:DUF3987 domain-containing protein [Herpetosiphon geysericola]KPL80290.1 hypothetical protein SE18_24895 [Herpetosiphon geysericola]